VSSGSSQNEKICYQFETAFPKRSSVASIEPFLGRLLDRTDDDHPEASDPVVLSWPAWNSYFGADPNIVGKKVRLNKHPYTIVGVTPQGFYGTEKFLQPDVFVPMALTILLTGGISVTGPVRKALNADPALLLREQ
jgi:MacB-like periplasmic core domain